MHTPGRMPTPRALENSLRPRLQNICPWAFRALGGLDLWQVHLAKTAEVVGATLRPYMLEASQPNMSAVLAQSQPHRPLASPGIYHVEKERGMLKSWNHLTDSFVSFSKYI